MVNETYSILNNYMATNASTASNYYISWMAEAINASTTNSPWEYTLGKKRFTYKTTAATTIYPCDYYTTATDEDWIVTTPEWSLKWDYKPKIKSASERLQEIIQSRLAPAIHTTRQSVPTPQDPREVKAHDTLRVLIGPQRYRQFIKNGYVTIHSQQNGKTYQVFPGQKFTRVYDHGQREPDLCIYLAHNFPPTDQLIAKILLIQTDPNHYHRIANKHQPPRPTLALPPEPVLSLPEIYRAIKKAKVA